MVIVRECMAMGGSPSAGHVHHGHDPKEPHGHDPKGSQGNS